MMELVSASTGRPKRRSDRCWTLLMKRHEIPSSLRPWKFSCRGRAHITVLKSLEYALVELNFGGLHINGVCGYEHSTQSQNKHCHGLST